MKTTKTKKPRAHRPRYAALRKMLVERREELLDQMHGGLADSRRDPLGARFDDLADRANDSLYDELARGLAEIATADLRKIERAIEKIDNKAYGRCESCGRRIPQARLRMLPFADLCVECQREEEQEAADSAG